MNLTVAGVALLIAYSVHHLILAARSAREAARTASVRATGSKATPRVFWIVVAQPASPHVVTTALGLRAPSGTQVRVLVLDDGSCPGLSTQDADGVHVLRHRTGQDPSEALNMAYRWIRDRVAAERRSPWRTVIGILDGTTVPSSRLLLAAALPLQDRAVGAVQCRVRGHHRGALGAAQDHELSVVIDAEQTLRGRDGTALLGFNGAFIRLAALQGLGDRPWEAGATEGMRLGLRLREQGHEIRYVPHASVTIGAADWRGLVRQRTRWAQGQLQSLPLASRLRGGLATAVPAVGLGASWLAGVVVAAVFGLFAVAASRLLRGDVPASYADSWTELTRAALVWASVAVAPGVIWWVARRGAVRPLGTWAYPALLVVRSWALTTAVARQLVGRRTWNTYLRRAESRWTPPAFDPDDDAPVFVDLSGRRRRRIRFVAYGFGMAGVAQVVLFGLSLMIGPVSPQGVGAPLWSAFLPTVEEPAVVVEQPEPEPTKTPTPTTRRSPTETTRPTSPPPSTTPAPSTTTPPVDPTTTPPTEPETTPPPDPTTEPPPVDPTPNPVDPTPTPEPNPLPQTGELVAGIRLELF